MVRCRPIGRRVLVALPMPVACRFSETPAGSANTWLHRRPFASRGISHPTKPRSSQNIERDLHVWVRNLHNLSIRPFFLELPLWDGDMVRPVSVPVLLPHEWVAALYKAGSQHFQESLLSDLGDDAIDAFWEWYLQQPWGSSHPCAVAGSRKHIPFAIHTDGGDSYTNSELVVWSLSSVLVHGLESWDGRFLLCTIPAWRLATQQIRNTAMEKFLDLLAWSFAALAEGTWPTSGPVDMELDPPRVALGGQTLAEGYAGTYVLWKGDRKSRVQEHRLVRTWQTTQVCEYCEAVVPYKKAVSPLLSYGDNRADASWP